MRDYKYGDLYFDTQHDKQMKIDVVGTGIVIDNSMIEMEAFELDETLCSESELKFGRCEANCVKFTARNLPGSINGKTINITETIDGNTDEPFPYGKYKVQSDVPTSDRTKREITAYDAIYDIINADMKSWYARLSFPMTLRQFRDRFFAYFGITQKETTLVNDGMTVNKTLTATQTDSESTITEESAISGKTVIEAICEVNGVFGNINRDGLFEYVELEPIIQPLYPSNDLYPREDLLPRDPNTISMTGHYITFDYEDFQSKAITQLEIRPSDDSAGVIVGTSGNNYVISGNFLVSDKTGAELETIAENTLSVIKKAAYIPIKSSNIVGNPCVELGDPIRFNTTREIVESYVLQRTLTGIQSKRDSITASGTETHSANVNSIKDTISNLSGRTNKLERTADHTLSEIKAVDSKVNELDSSVQESVSELDSKIDQTASSITTEVSQKVTEINNSISTVDGKVNNVDGKVDDLSSTVTTSVSELNSRIEQTAEHIQTEVARATGAESILSSNITQNAESIQSEVINRQNADNEMSTKISQTAHSVAIVATGGDNSVGIEIQLYDENGNLIDTKSETANITITGFVSFQDLENAGQTTINGANITTGNISCDRLSGGTIKGQKLEGCNAVFNDGADAIRIKYFDKDDWRYYMGLRAGYMWIHNASGQNVMNGVICDNREFFVGVNDNTDTSLDPRTYINFCKDNVNGDTIEFYCNGNRRPIWRKYVNGRWLGYDIAIKDDIPNMSNYATKTDISGFITGIDVKTTDKSGTSGYTKSYFLRVSGAGKYTTVSASQIYLSDRRSKEFIADAQDISRFYMLLNPVHFKYKDDVEGVDGHWHYGFIAQDVKQAFVDAGIESYNEALVGHDVDNDVWLLNKDEFHAMHVQMIQKQHKEIESLKQENLALQNRLSILEQKMEVLENAYNNKNN